MPTRWPAAPSRCAVRRTVVVLPLVPATATTGMRPSSPSAYMLAMMASPTLRPLPKDGFRCMRRPGAALTSTTPPCCSSSGYSTLSATMSTPQMSRPIIRAADTRARHLGMDLVGHVGGRAAGAQVGVVAQEDQRARGRHGIGVIALFLQRGQGDVVEADLGQRGGVAVAAQRVGVDLLDQLADGVAAVAGDLRRIAARGRDQVAAHHQQAEVMAGDVALDDDFRADFLGHFEGLDHAFARLDVDGHAAALAAVARRPRPGRPVPGRLPRLLRRR